MLKTIENAIRGMPPQKRPGGIVRVSGASIHMTMDAPHYGLYRGRDGALWVQATIGITGDQCWYGPIPKDDPRHTQLMAAAKGGTGPLKAVRTRLGRMLGRNSDGDG